MINITVEEAKQMRDYISKSALVDRLSDAAANAKAIEESSCANASTYYAGIKCGFRNAAIIADNFPTVDAVPVTRCRDCKHRQAKLGDCYGNAVVLCKDGLWRDMEFFCADGERSEE